MATPKAKQIETARWKAFGRFLLAKRNESRLTQGEAAERAQIDRQTWYRTEAGKPTSYATVVSMAQALDGSIQEFVEAAGFKYQPGDVGNAIREGSSQSKPDVIPSPDASSKNRLHKDDRNNPKVKIRARVERMLQDFEDLTIEEQEDLEPFVDALIVNVVRHKERRRM